MTEEERKALAEALNTTESKELLAKVEKGGVGGGRFFSNDLLFIRSTRRINITGWGATEATGVGLVVLF